MTNNQLNRERLEKIKSWRETYGAGSNVMLPAEEAEELARIALAAMDSEPVAWRWRWSDDAEGYWRYTEEQRETRGSVTAQPLYRHAQQPVVPPAIEPDYEVIKSILPTSNPDEYACCIAADMWNACRAAMLQAQSSDEDEPTDDERIMAIEGIHSCERCGDEGWVVGEMGITRCACVQAGNSPANPDCWCLTCRPVAINDMRFVVCPDCGNKRCPRANDHRNACTGSNEPGQEGSAYPADPQEVPDGK
ncbi:hypothetical protein [Klebsiella variicola]|uniref:hypothetical protein n=1 Tax=Klebsiella variicola TaxID=244366 RepID=UPI00215C8C59|nr:hypothetical protein [Klebsiella variicola]